MRRIVLKPKGGKQTESVTNFAHAVFRFVHDDAPSSEHAFTDISDLAAEDHLAILAATQEFIDSSISKTVSLPKADYLRELRGNLAQSL